MLEWQAAKARTPQRRPRYDGCLRETPRSSSYRRRVAKNSTPFPVSIGPYLYPETLDNGLEGLAIGYGVFASGKSRYKIAKSGASRGHLFQIDNNRVFASVCRYFSLRLLVSK